MACPIDRLKSLKWSLAAPPELLPKGSYEREAMRLMLLGIEHEIDWCIAQLEKAGEGQKHFQLEKF